MSAAGLGYAITDARSTFTGYLNAGKILAPKSDNVAGKVEADAATDVISLWFDQADDFFDQINEILTGNRDIPGSLVIGDQTTSAILKFDKSTTGHGYLEFLDAGTVRWQLAHNGSDDDFKLYRYNSSGVFQGTSIRALSSTARVIIDTDLRIEGGATSLGMGDYSDNVTISLKAPSGKYVLQQYIQSSSGNTSGDKAIYWEPTTKELILRHHDGTSWNNHARIDGTGFKLQGGSHLLSGTGVPSSSTGVDGDFWFRTNGGSGTKIYFKASGAWSAFA